MALQQIFCRFGKVDKIVMFDKGSGFQALVQMADVYTAMNAHEAADMQVWVADSWMHRWVLPSFFSVVSGASPKTVKSIKLGGNEKIMPEVRMLEKNWPNHRDRSCSLWYPSLFENPTYGNIFLRLRACDW